MEQRQGHSFASADAQPDCDSQLNADNDAHAKSDRDANFHSKPYHDTHSDVYVVTYANSNPDRNAHFHACDPDGDCYGIRHVYSNAHRDT